MPDDDLEETPPVAENDNEVIRTLRAQAKEGQTARAEADAARRELAFVKAGIDPDDPRQKYFVQGYQGAETADAIRAEAEAAGFLGQATTSDQGMTDAERQAFAASAQAAAGGGNEQPEEDLYAEFRGKSGVRSGVTPEQFAIAIAQKLESNGGEVRYDGPFREWKGDTGIIPRPGTPLPRRI